MQNGVFKEPDEQRTNELKKELETFNPNSRWNRKRKTGEKARRKKLKTTKRDERLMPNGKPRYVRCYYNHGRDVVFTVVFTSRVEDTEGNRFFLEIYRTDEISVQARKGFIDRPSYIHLGKKVSFDFIPERLHQRIINHYKTFWGIKDVNTSEIGNTEDNTR